MLVVNEEREKALPLGKTLLAKLPHDFNVLYLNGVLEREGGDYVAARDHLEAAVQLNPNHPDCRYNLGVVLARLNQPTEARDQLEKALALGWIGPEIHYELANVYRALGDTDLAAQQMKLYQQENHAREERTVAASKAAQADQEMRSGDLKLAALHYREASEATPRNLLLSYKLALALDATGDTSEEQSVLEKPPPSIQNTRRSRSNSALSRRSPATRPPQNSTSGAPCSQTPTSPRPGSAWQQHSPQNRKSPKPKKPSATRFSSSRKTPRHSRSRATSTASPTLPRNAPEASTPRQINYQQ